VAETFRSWTSRDRDSTEATAGSACIVGPMDDEEQAFERNDRLTAALAEAGKALGLGVECEYPVPGGRIDVVWLWDGPERFPVRLPWSGSRSSRVGGLVSISRVT
jgi:hypothetical protein